LEFHEIYNFWGSVIAAWGWTVNWSLSGEKILLYIVWFAYSLLSLILSLGGGGGGGEGEEDFALLLNHLYLNP